MPKNVETWTSEQYREYFTSKQGTPVNKYRAKKMTTGEIKADSIKEGKYSWFLDYCMRLPETDPDHVVSYTHHKKFPIIINGYQVTVYECDYEVNYKNRVEVVDQKGYKKGLAYQHFKLKKALMKSVLGIEVIEL